MKDLAYQDGRELVGGCPHDIFYIAPTPIDLDGLYMQVNRAGITCRTPQDFLINRNDTYRFSVVHCVFSGRGSVTARGRTYPLEKGQLFVLAAHEPHTYGSDAEDPMGLAWVEFGGGGSTPMVQHLLDQNGPVFGREVFQDVMSLCTSILYHPEPRGPKISGILYDMLIQLCAVAEGKGRQSTANQEVLKYIEDHLGSHLTLAEVAAQFGYHPSYFSTRFTKLTGMPFSKYVMCRRMSHACLLLMTTQLSIEQIAQGLGFYDISHFTQRFKAAEGITPSRYRKESRGLTAQTDSMDVAPN